MKMIDPHLHIDSRTREDLTSMATAGISAVVTLTYYPHLHLSITSQTLLDYFERVINFETCVSDVSKSPCDIFSKTSTQQPANVRRCIIGK